MSHRRKRVLFDQTQNERGRLDSTYAQLGQLLKDNDFEVEPYTEYMILSKSIANCDVFVFACPNSSKLRSAEIDALKRFVSDGGGLMMLSLSGGDRGLMNNMSQLSKVFGIEFENTAVKDERSNGELATMPLITDVVPHPSVEGVRGILMPSACSLRLTTGATAVASTSVTADPAKAPVAAVAEAGKGRVMCIGSYEVFRRGGGMKHEDNLVLAVSAFRWLASELRTPKPSEVAAAQTTSDKTQPAPSRGGSQETTTDMDLTLKRLVNALVDLQKDVSKVTAKVDKVDENIKMLRDQFHEFAEKTRSQLGVVIPAKQFQSEDEQKAAQALADIKAIEREMESVQQLREHVEQKLASGTMTRETYEEQIQKLDVKLANLNTRAEKRAKDLGKRTPS